MRSFETGVIIVNWNGWRDTIECLEATFRMHDFDGRVVVVDNGTDESVEMIQAWARGMLCAVPQNPHPRIRALVVPPLPKPMACTVINHGDVDHAGSGEQQDCRLFIVRSADNLGFAAANNLGIRLLLTFPTIKLLWLLNNDALPQQGAHTEVLAATGHAAGPLICGSALIEYWAPGVVQALGGRFSRYICVGHHLMAGAPVDDLASLPSRVAVDYPVGASLVVNRLFVEQLGGMCEDYFLYFEEIDWVLRTGSPGSAFVVPRSLVFHKGGTSTAAGRDPAEKSLLSDYYMLRGRLLLARKLPWWLLLTTLFGNMFAILRRVVRPRPGVVVNAIAATRDGILGVKGRRAMRA